MLTAYVDETGQDAKDWVFIAGFVGNEEQWGKFVPLWKQALGPQRKNLHLADIRFKKEYERHLLARLAPIPLQVGLEPVLGGVRVSDYSDLLLGNEFLEKLHCGFLSALMPLVIQLLDWLPPDERVEIVFEQQDRYYGLTDFVFSELVRRGNLSKTSDGKSKLAKWSSIPKGDSCLTEPADYLAYAVAQHYKDENSIRAQWTQPIIESVDTVQAIGHILNRVEARDAIARLLKCVKMANVLVPGSGTAFEIFRGLANRASKIPLDERE